MSICTLCELHKTCNSVKIEPDGEGDIVFLGEAPGREEDNCGVPFVGKSGQLLRQIIEAFNIPPERVRFTNAVRCRPPENKTPSKKHIKTCSVHLKEEFQSRPPKIVVALGSVALASLKQIGLVGFEGKIMALQGKVLEGKNTLVLPMLHPAYILRNPQSIPLYNESFETLSRIINEGFHKKKTDYFYSTDIDDLRAAVDLAKGYELLAYDIETSCLHPKAPGARYVSFAFCWAEGESFGFYLTPETYQEALQILHDEILENVKLKKIIHHAKFELLWSMSLGRTISNIADTMLMHWHLDERKGTHGLGILASSFTDMGFYENDLESYKAGHPEANPDKAFTNDEGEKVYGSYANIPKQILMPYNCADTDAAFRLYNAFLPRLNEKQKWVYENIQIPSCYPFAKMEFGGARIDWDYLEELSVDLLKQTADIEQKVFEFPEVQKFKEKLEENGKEFKFNSVPQTRALLFEHLRLKPLYLTEKGEPATDQDVLEYFGRSNPMIAYLAKRRLLAQRHSTFVVGARKKRLGDHLHTSYGLVHTETGRPNSSGPNLQNIPREDIYRMMYVPDDDRSLLVQADYSQIELRIMALKSGDKNLLDYFRQGLDVHRMIASRIHKKPPEEINKEERVLAKRTVFGLCYGQGAQGLAEELGIPLEESEEFLSKFFKEFPAVKKWMEGTREKAVKTGEVETIFGRVRRLQDAMIANNKDPAKARALRQAVNAPIQGTATDVVVYKLSEVYEFIEREKLKTRMILTVHDSINFSVPVDEINYFIPAARLIMEDCEAFPWAKIPLLVDFEVGSSWGSTVSLSRSDVESLEKGESIFEIIERLLEAKNE